MSNVNLRTLSTSLAVAVGMFAGTPCHAAFSQRVLAANATSFCQTALPVFDGQVRKRPLAVQNEGTSNAFVTCSFTKQNGIGSGASKLSIFAVNVGPSQESITCTLVTGTAYGLNEYVAKTILIPSHSKNAMLWEAADFATGIFPDDQYSASCNLLPGVGLADSYLIFSEDIGT